MRNRLTIVTVVVMAVAACGGIPDVAGLADIDEEDFEPGASASDNAMATLVVEDQTYVWEKNEWTYCEIGGNLPVWASFQQSEARLSDDWVQFIDRGDGGINFSAYLDGEEYSGTGSGEADEIRTDGFSYTGDMGVNGESVDVSLDVTC